MGEPLTTALIIKALDEGSKNTPVIKDIRAALAKVGSKSVYVKGKENAIAVLSFSESYLEIKNLIKKNPELSKLGLVRDFLKEYNLEEKIKSDKDSDSDIFGEFIKLYNDEGVYFVNKKDESRIYKKIVENKAAKEPKEKINIVPLNEVKLFDEYKKENKLVEKEILEIIKQLSPEYQSLASLSIFTGKLYNKRKIEEAESVKYTILKRYNKFGLKFCNLYNRGYLKVFLMSLYVRKQKGNIDNLQREIDHFINDIAESILFIYPNMPNEEKYYGIYKIKTALTNSKDYSAIHSLGSDSMEIAKTMAKEIGSLCAQNYNIKFIKEKNQLGVTEWSKVWFRNQTGMNIYSMIHDPYT